MSLVRHLLLLGVCLTLATPSTRGDVLVVVGAPGESVYADRFEQSAVRLRDAVRTQGLRCDVIGLDETEPPSATDARTDDRQAVLDWLIRTGSDRPGAAPAWIIYLGHGTWDGSRARLNLRGPDLDDESLAHALRDFLRPLVFVHGGSASAPFIKAVSAPRRVVVTATSTGDEANFARFGESFVDALLEPGADIDRDGRTSLLEAALHASRAVRTFYDEAGRMATEHALVDDNGDGLGTPLEWFDGTRVTRRDEQDRPTDGALAHRIALFETELERALSPERRAERDALEAELERLRLRKAGLEPHDYLRELEIILRRIAPFYADPSRSGDS